MADDKGPFSKPSNLTKWQGCKQFLWNSDTKECLGRTGMSWLKITVFYIIFYSCLAAFWTVMLIIFYQTLSSSEPRWQLDSSRIGSSPGLGFRPRPPEDNIDSTLIWFNADKQDTIDHWVKNLEEFLKPYKSQRNVSSCSIDQGPGDDKTCYFSIDKINDKCSTSSGYGYPARTPCVLIKLNRIYNWVPEPYKNASDLPSGIPEDIKMIYSPDYVWISCIGENAADKDNIGDVEYLPEQGISVKFFPFKNQKEYLSPFVFVRFKDIAKNVLVNIECKAWAKNIKYDRGDRLGSVHFELLVD
ncbi:sodium/potassium-transporting ATPase subunit beta [Centruroides vittatus]|uniref:sodium/potassium-transporting ATPase subunit beta n=1 Tax=Centruroides vittatus TaxID=120091 RepID=UPI00350FEF61